MYFYHIWSFWPGPTRPKTCVSYFLLTFLAKIKFFSSKFYYHKILYEFHLVFFIYY